MPWRIELSRAAEKDLADLPKHVRLTVARALDRLATDPGRADVRKLVGRSDEWRLRAGRWRVRFRFDGTRGTIYVLRIVHRSSAYEP